MVPNSSFSACAFFARFIVFAKWDQLARLVRAFITSERLTVPILSLAAVVLLLAALGPLVSNRFHRDEAIYSSWALDIASGRDLLISGSAVDKPPLFFYIQALSFLLFSPGEVSARLPSLGASLVGVGLLFVLGRSLYGRGVGLLTAFLLAASPFAILFAPTAFTDPMMVTWVLAGCLAAVKGNWVLAGSFLGLASITKQQGAFFTPLALALGLASSVNSANRHIPNPRSKVIWFLVAFLVVSSLAIGWDLARARRPGFLIQSLVSYGGLPVSISVAWRRLVGFVNLLQYGTGSPVLNGALVIGLPLLLFMNGLQLLGYSRRFPGRLGELGPVSRIYADLSLVTFVAIFLLGHSLVAFEVWDRYLLGLIPLLVLLLARVLTLPQRLLNNLPLPSLVCCLFVLWMLSFTFRPIRDAAASRFPVGGDHAAYQGITQVVSFFKAVPADTTLYHRWLGWHWRFYLWGSPYDFRSWTSPTDLAAQAGARPGASRYIVFPSWHSSTEVRLALNDAGLMMREVQRVFRDDGGIAFFIYRIEETP